ncbi:MAG: molybdenum cofactor guanylyltransferase MobA [Rubellimicrobium sp.]|nr:molybdenum cofactor guanylyltransferase MobA [Rubellimicrobium sp.]
MDMPAAVILAGGLATRMGGGDKGLRPWRRATLLDAVIARIAPQVGALALNANGDAARFARFGLPVLPDPVPGHPGPLAGVLAALEWTQARGRTRVLTVPCDTPDLPADLVRHLRAADAGRGAVAADASGRLHPTVALWPVALAPALADYLSTGGRRVGRFAAQAGLAVARFPAAAADPFANVNSPDDLQ